VKTDSFKEQNRLSPILAFAFGALKVYKLGVQSNLRLQIQAGQCWNWMLCRANGCEEWPIHFNRATELANDILDMARERLEEILAVMKHSSGTGSELMKQALDAGQAPGVSESQARWLEYWTSSVSTARTSGAALAKIANNSVDSWVEVIQKHTERMGFSSSWSHAQANDHRCWTQLKA